VTLVLFQLFAFGAGEITGETVSGETTVKVAELLVPAPGTETTTGIAPRATPLGTGTTMLVLLQLVGVAEIPPKVTVLVPCVVPNPVPAIVTDVPIGPDAGVTGGYPVLGVVSRQGLDALAQARPGTGVAVRRRTRRGPGRSRGLVG